jgi:hypothetical protein
MGVSRIPEEMSRGKDRGKVVLYARRGNVFLNAGSLAPENYQTTINHAEVDLNVHVSRISSRTRRTHLVDPIVALILHFRNIRRPYSPKYLCWMKSVGIYE